jgi:RNA recognition motif-containing protein
MKSVALILERISLPTCSRRSHLGGHDISPFRFDPERLVGSTISGLRRNLLVGKKLYVGNLSYNVTNQDLEQLFSEFGEVRSAQVIQDRDTGRSKGFGFVEMNDDNAAQTAIQSLHDKEHDGRRLTVNEAKPREERGGGSYGRSGGGNRNRRY